ncbi:MAG: PACE efflux transporter [Betaproteobacteria bacterium]|nr:PACE efflux transporter [Betaproteobacteria bacterium]
MSHGVPLRSLKDRLRQIALFEGLGLLLITPGFAWASDQPLESSFALLAVLSLMAALWNGSYNTAADWLQAHHFGTRADQRGWRGRIIHAVCFEGGLLLLTLPVIAAWTGLSWWATLVADLGLAATYTTYALVFNLGYDRLFPIAGRRD